MERMEETYSYCHVFKLLDAGLDPTDRNDK
jgi:hypothetical protein